MVYGAPGYFVVANPVIVAPAIPKTDSIIPFVRTPTSIVSIGYIVPADIIPVYSIIPRTLTISGVSFTYVDAISIVGHYIVYYKTMSAIDEDSNIILRDCVPNCCGVV